MKKFNTILVPYDLSEASEAALHFTLSFCMNDNLINVILVHNTKEENIDVVVKELEASAENIKKLHKAYRGIIQVQLTHNDLFESILEKQKETNADLIIMGTNYSDEDGARKDSRTSKLVLEADCPVMVVPNNTREFSLKKLVLVIDRKEIDDKKNLEVLLAVAQRFDAKVNVLTIYEDAEEFTYDKDDALIEDALEYALYTFYESHAFKKGTDILKTILDYVKENEIDMLAILPRNHAKKNTPSEGRLTKLLALKTNIPLLTID